MQTWVGAKKSGDLGTGVSSDKGHMSLNLRTPKQELGEAVNVEGETRPWTGTQRIL